MEKGHQLSTKSGICLLLVIAGSWGWLLYSAHYYWQGDSYYNYGWIVPLLVGYILYRKFRGARAIEGPPAGKGRCSLLIGAFAGAILLVTVLQLILEVNPGWRVPLWGYGILLLSLSYFATLLLAGWKGFQYLAFPFFFLMLALPWPMTMETAVIQSLTRWVTDLTVFTVNLIGYPAVAMGNTIIIGEASVGVDEACSGIRSLQSLVMVAFFLGEFFRMGLLKRGVLLLAALGISIGFNGVRAVILTMVELKGTDEKFAFWHDTLGNFNAIIIALLLLAVAELVMRLFPARKDGDEPVLLRVRPLPGNFGIGIATTVVAGFVVSALAVEGYYRWHQWRAEPLPSMALQWPGDGYISHIPSKLPETTLEILQCEYHTQAEIRWSTGMNATLVYYGYTGEDLSASLSGYGHTPLVCMTASGARLKAEKPPMPIEIGGIPWKVNHYEFVSQLPHGKAHTMEVFFLVWEPRQMGIPTELMERRSNWENRWAVVKNGRRDFGRQVLLVYVSGDYEDGYVRDKFTDLVDRIVRLEGAEPAGAS